MLDKNFNNEISSIKEDLRKHFLGKLKKFKFKNVDKELQNSKVHYLPCVLIYIVLFEAKHLVIL